MTKAPHAWSVAKNQYGGARFAKDIAGTSKAETNLHAVVGALPTGAVAQPSMQDLVECREPPECANRRAARRNLIASLITNWRCRRSMQKLRPRQKQAAFPLCRPFEIERSARGSAMELRSCRNYSWHPSVDQIRTIAARAADTPGRDAMLRQLL